jgi:hypothetical protein
VFEHRCWSYEALERQLGGRARAGREPPDRAALPGAPTAGESDARAQAPAPGRR